MEDIAYRPKYSRQTSTTRGKKKDAEVDVVSTAFALKMLVVVVIIVVFALCRAADNEMTNNIITKFNEKVVKANYDTNSYISKILSGFGGSLEYSTPSQNSTNEAAANAIANGVDKEEINTGAADTGNKANINDTDNTVATKSKNNSSNASALKSEQSTDITNAIQILGEDEIKAIANKFSFIMPVNGKILSVFGPRTNSLGKEFHSGIDIDANEGASIKAALRGTVIEAGSSPEYGNYIKIKHNDDIYTVYAHCSRLIAKKGEEVNQGDVVAKVGDTEGEAGSQLHFEIRKGDKLIDPEKLFSYQNK